MGGLAADEGTTHGSEFSHGFMCFVKLHLQRKLKMRSRFFSPFFLNSVLLFAAREKRFFQSCLLNVKPAICCVYIEYKSCSHGRMQCVTSSLLKSFCLVLRQVEENLAPVLEG